MIYLMAFFLIISFIYAKGMLSIFRNNFRWHMASVLGIAVVVLTTAQFVWGTGNMISTEYAVWSLFWIFLAALPGMTYHGKTYLKQQREVRNQLRQAKTDIIDLTTENAVLERERFILREEKETLKDDILPILKRVEDKQNNEAEMLAELSGILNMRLWAENWLEKRKN